MPARAHQDHRRRRRLRALPLRGRDLEVRLLRLQPAQVAHGADRHGLLYVRKRTSRPVADAAAAASQADNIASSKEIGTHPAATTTPLRGAGFLRGIASSARPRAPFTSRTAGRGASRRFPACDPHAVRPAQSCGLANVGLDAVDCQKLGETSGPGSASSSCHQAGGLPGHSRHAERVHHARRDRHVRGNRGGGSARSSL